MELKKGLIYNAIKRKNLTMIIVACIFIMGLISYIGIPK